VGCFDLLHVGHLRHLQEARKMGNRLLVGVTMDDYVGKSGRPIIPEDDRLETIKALRCVTGAALCVDSLDALRLFAPDIFCKGHDYIAKKLLPEELKFCAEHEIEIRYTKPNLQTTSGIIERIKCA
jgi:D-beta-D-heptose 7-phosphate kinase/D-beta-D-heptose 1-phosphate adenosyltransferase